MLEMTKPLDVLLVLQRVLDGEDAAPRMAQEEEVVSAQPQREPHLLDLVDEPVEVPQIGVIGLVAVSRAELVVVVVLDACSREVAVGGLEVFVRGGRATVQEEHRTVSRPRSERNVRQPDH